MSVGVAVVHDDARVLDEVAHALDGMEGLHLAGLGEERDAEVVLLGGRHLPVYAPGRAGIVVLSTGVPLDDARVGFALGASGIVRWPDDAKDLGRAVAAAAASRTNHGEARAPAIAIFGARGGAGTTTIAALLARAIAGAIVVDLDFTGAGQRAFADEDAGDGFTRVAAVPMADVVADASERHAAGRAILVHPGAAVPSDAQVASVIAAARSSASCVVADLGRIPALVPAWVTALVLVCADDVPSLRAARRFFDAGADPHVVLNRLRRRGLRPAHVERALGREPVAVLPPDRRLARATDLGVLPRRLPRAIERLSAAVTR